MEKWKYIEGTNHKYQASNLGRVRRMHAQKWRKEYTILKGSPDGSGYMRHHLSIDGKSFGKHVHRIIAETFVNNTNNLPNVNHKDGNKKNNCAINLEWVTPKGNAIHAASLFLYPYGEKHHQSKLTKKDVIEIRRLSDLKVKQRDIAKQFNINQRNVWQIIHKITWKHI